MRSQELDITLHKNNIKTLAKDDKYIFAGHNSVNVLTATEPYSSIWFK